MWVCVFILLWYHAKTCACGVLCRKCVGSLKCPEQKEKLKYSGFRYKLGVPVKLGENQSCHKKCLCLDHNHRIVIHVMAIEEKQRITPSSNVGNGQLGTWRIKWTLQKKIVEEGLTEGQNIHSINLLEIKMFSAVLQSNPSLAKKN